MRGLVANSDIGKFERLIVIPGVSREDPSTYIQIIVIVFVVTLQVFIDRYSVILQPF